MGLTDDELAIVAKFACLLDDPTAAPGEVALAARRAINAMHPSPGLTDHLARSSPHEDGCRSNARSD